MLFPSAVRRDPAVDAWFAAASEPLGSMAREWFDRMRACGPEVRELIHDGAPTACVEAAAFAYVNVFTAHAAVGFFQGASLADPGGLLEGAGKRMRHVKLRFGAPPDAAAVADLIAGAHLDMRRRLGLT